MLRILRMMQFLTVLIEQVPERIVTERERIEAMIAEIAAYHRVLEERLTALPPAIAKGMSPDTVAASINESLRQQFERSTIPQTAGALSAVAADIKRVTTELDRSARKMGRNGRSGFGCGPLFGARGSRSVTGDQSGLQMVGRECRLVGDDGGTHRGRDAGVVGQFIVTSRGAVVLTIRAMADGKGYSVPASGTQRLLCRG